MFTKTFWKDALERAIKTAAQTAVATIGTTAVIEGVEWLVVGSASALAAILSVLTSIASTGYGEPESASLVSLKEGEGEV